MFQNNVDPDQLASQKPADQNLHCFPNYLQMHANYLNYFKGFDYKSGEECSALNCQAR